MTEHIYEGALRKLIAEQSSDNKTLLHDFSTAFFNSIQQGLLKDGHIRLHNFGSYQLKWSKQRKGRHPQTGEEIIIPAQPRIVFTPAKHLKEQVNRLNTSQLEGTTLLPAINATAQAVEAVEAVEAPKISTNQKTLLKEERSVSRQDNGACVEPYLIKNIPARKTLDEKHAPLQAIAAAIMLALVGLYFFQPGDTQTTLAVSSSNDIDSVTLPEKQLTAHTNDTRAQASPQIDIIDSTPAFSNDDSYSDASAVPVLQKHVMGDTTEQANDQPVNLVTAASPLPDELYFKSRNHKLMNGDSLWRLSKTNYINPLYWPHIYQANRYAIKNPNKLYIGKTIELPDLYGKPENLSPVDRRNIAEGYFLLYLHHKKTGKKLPYFALLGVAKFDPAVIREHDFEIAEEDWKNLHIASN